MLTFPLLTHRVSVYATISRRMTNAAGNQWYWPQATTIGGPYGRLWSIWGPFFLIGMSIIKMNTPEDEHIRSMKRS